MSPLQHVTVQLAPSGKALFRQAAKKHNNLGVDRNETRQTWQEAMIPPTERGVVMIILWKDRKSSKNALKIRIKTLNDLETTYGRLKQQNKSGCGSDFNWRLKRTITKRETNSRNKLRTLKVIKKIALGLLEINAVFK